MNILFQFFRFVKDFRSKRGQRYELPTILTIIFSGFCYGCSTYQEIYQFSQENVKFFIDFLNITSGKLPSYSTIRRVIMGLEEEDFFSIFYPMIDCFYDHEDVQDYIAIDGKTLKGTVTNYKEENQNTLNVVSAFSCEENLIIDYRSFEGKKTSEVSVVKELIQQITLINKVFTLDAAHCNKQTIQIIIERCNDYLITVKKNQIKLFEELELITNKEQSLSNYEKKDFSHGRQITRVISVFDGEKIKHKNYQHAQSIILINRSGKRGKKDYEEKVYYISSRKETAETFAQKIQGHWKIENMLHWVKDAIFKEDKRRIKCKNSQNKMSLITSIIINFLRIIGFESIKQGIDWKVKKMEDTITKS